MVPETRGYDDPALREVNIRHTVLDERQQKPRVELEHVVRDSGQHVGDDPE